MIEPCWPWMKKTTTARGAPQSRVKMELAWNKAWSDIPQSQIQAWIERMPHHIQEVIRLKGGNEYEEGRKAFKRNWAGTRIKGKLSKHTYLQAQGEVTECSLATKADEWDDIENDLDETESD
jgi:hypothetical protein